MQSEFEKEWNDIEAKYYALKEDTLANRLTDTSAGLVIFGAGNYGYAFAELLEPEPTINSFIAFCDNSKTGVCKKYSVPIISPEELRKNPGYSNIIIVIAASSAYRDEIYNQLIDLEIAKERIFILFVDLDLSIMQFFRKTMLEKFRKSYSLEESELRRAETINRIRSILLPNEMEYISPLEVYSEESSAINEYESCDALEDLHLVFQGNVDIFHGMPPIRYCCAPVDGRPDLSFCQTPEETFRCFMALRNEIIAESIKFNLLSAPPHDSERVFTSACAKCDKYQTKKWKNGKNSLFHMVILGFYPAYCNAKCIYCCIHYYPNKLDIKSLEKLFCTVRCAVENDAIAENAQWLVACGEITVHPLRDSILGLVGNRTTRFFSNCFVFNQMIADNLSCNQNSELLFSIDAGTPETWKRIKRTDNFKKVIGNVKKYSQGCILPNQILLKYIILPGINDNKRDYEGIIKIMADLNVNFLELSRNTRTIGLQTAEENETLIQSAGRLGLLLAENGMEIAIYTVNYRQAEIDKILAICNR